MLWPAYVSYYLSSLTSIVQKILRAGQVSLCLYIFLHYIHYSFFLVAFLKFTLFKWPCGALSELQFRSNKKTTFALLGIPPIRKRKCLSYAKSILSVIYFFPYIIKSLASSKLTEKFLMIPSKQNKAEDIIDVCPCKQSFLSFENMVYWNITHGTHVCVMSTFLKTTTCP